MKNTLEKIKQQMESKTIPNIEKETFLKWGKDPQFLVTCGFVLSLMLPALFKGNSEGYYIIKNLIILLVGTMICFFWTKYILKGDTKITVCVCILLSLGWLVDMKMKTFEFVLCYIGFLMGGYLFYKVKWIRYDIVNGILAFGSVSFYIILRLFGGDSSGNRSGVYNYLKIPGINFNFPVTEVIKVVFIMILVCLLCKNGISEERKGKRFFLATLYTAVNAFGMLLISEMGSMLIMLLTYIALAIVYSEKKRWMYMALGGGFGSLFVLCSGCELMIDQINRDITPELLEQVVFGDIKNSYKNTLDSSFRKVWISYLEQRKEEENNLDDCETLLANLKMEKRGSMRKAFDEIVKNQEEKVAFLNSGFYSRIYEFYTTRDGAEETTNIIQRFFIPKYCKVKKRIYCVFHPEWDVLGDGAQAARATIAIRQGGLFGKTNSNISILYNGEEDMAFAFLIEIYGCIVAIISTIYYCFLYFRGQKVAVQTKQHYNSGLAFAISFMIFIQTIICIASNCGMFPIVGIPLPFIALGSSAKIIWMTMVGVLVMMSSRQMEEVEEQDWSDEIMGYIGYFGGKTGSAIQKNAREKTKSGVSFLKKCVKEGKKKHGHNE